jgi:hypothetical protein
VSQLDTSSLGINYSFEREREREFGGDILFKETLKKILFFRD